MNWLTRKSPFRGTTALVAACVLAVCLASVGSGSQPVIVRISPGDHFFICNGQDVPVSIGLVELLDIESDIVSVSGFCPENFEWIGLLAGNGDRLFNVGSRLADQTGIGWIHACKVDYRTGDVQCDPCVVRVVGEDLDVFFQGPAAVAAGVDLDADDSLAAGGDLPRVGGDRTPSAGFDLGYGKGAVSGIFYRKVMGDLASVNHRVEFIFQFWQHHAGLFDGRDGG